MTLLASDDWLYASADPTSSLDYCTRCGTLAHRCTCGGTGLNPQPVPPHPFVPFDSASASGNCDLGADALLYVMAHGHTISVPTIALHFAEQIGVLSIRQPRKVKDQPDVTVHPALLRDVNAALDLIADSLRRRRALDEEHAAATPSPTPTPEPKPNLGPMARLEAVPLSRPPSGSHQKVEVQF